MAVTPKSDKDAIRQIILNDSYIKIYLKFNNEDNISTQKDLNAEFNPKENYINIYGKQAEDTLNERMTECIYQIDILTENTKTGQSRADLCQEQLSKLLDNVWITPTKQIRLKRFGGNISTSKSTQYQIALQVGIYTTISGGKPLQYP